MTDASYRKKKLFDDSDEDEEEVNNQYKPEPENTPAQEVAYQPHQEEEVHYQPEQDFQEVEKQPAPKQQMFDDDADEVPYQPEPQVSFAPAEEEVPYQPSQEQYQEYEQNQQQVYTQEQVYDQQPEEGVMAEREQIMQNDDVTLTQEAQQQQNETVDIKEQAEKAKAQFVGEMMNMTDYNEAKALVKDEKEPVVEDERQQKFTVSNPVKIQGHIKYTVQGEDQDGAFEEVRRYKEFFALRNILLQRWPGIYIPAIPEKKVIGNKDDQFVEERRSLLERFMKELCKYDYLIYSQEFKIFARDKGDVEKVLAQLPRQTPMMILEKYRLNFQVQEERPAAEVAKYKESIREFQSFVKRALSVMEHQKDQLKLMIKSTDDRYAQQKQCIESLIAYEDANVDYYSDQNVEKRLFTNGANANFKEQLELTYQGFRNPYREAYIWLKGELLDLKGLNDAMLGRDAVIKAQGNTEQKRIADMSELDKRRAGKKTLKSVFKSSNAKEKELLGLEAGIKTAQQEIEDYKKLVHFLTLYIYEHAVAGFKKTKGLGYLKMLNGFCVKEISNSHSSATLWHQILETSGAQKQT